MMESVPPAWPEPAAPKRYEIVAAHQVGGILELFQSNNPGLLSRWLNP